MIRIMVERTVRADDFEPYLIIQEEHNGSRYVLQYMSSIQTLINHNIPVIPIKDQEDSSCSYIAEEADWSLVVEKYLSGDIKWGVYVTVGYDMKNNKIVLVDDEECP